LRADSPQTEKYTHLPGLFPQLPGCVAGADVNQNRVPIGTFDHQIKIADRRGTDYCFWNRTMLAAEGIPVHVGSTQQGGTATTAYLLTGVTQQSFKVTVDEMHRTSRIDAEYSIRALFDNVVQCVHPETSALDDAGAHSSLPLQFTYQNPKWYSSAIDCLYDCLYVMVFVLVFSYLVTLPGMSLS
jgi:hypothetical protein